ncbi:Holliday junction branch migration protein RuvA [Vicingaceae bacterium]|nr:Holliday junction branch migration protein RuvA [Vicingaceae bacterium]MDC1452238.1 Holliday junction branch migration protein RuvA [Vicingaceae bacterium]
MISHINGRLVEKSPTHVVIDCGGVGYKLNISLNTYAKLGEEESCKLFTEFIVREDAQLLYGFKEVSERRLFQLLISVSGIGPATALLVLSSADAEEIQQAILSGNAGWFKGVKGIGPKSAQRIIIDLKDKISKENISSDNSMGLNNTLKEESLSALVNLGFNKNIAEKMIQKILIANPNAAVEDVIKQALKGL